MFNPEFLTTEHNDGQAGNSLIQYLQEQSPDTPSVSPAQPAVKSRTSFATTFRGCWACFLASTSK